MKKNSRKKYLNPRKVLKGTKKSAKKVKGNKPVKKKKSKKKTLNIKNLSLKLQPEVSGRRTGHSLSRQPWGKSKHTKRSAKASRQSLQFQQNRKKRHAIRKPPVNRVNIMLERIRSNGIANVVEEIESTNPPKVTVKPVEPGVVVISHSDVGEDKERIGSGNFGKVFQVSATLEGKTDKYALKELEDQTKLKDFYQEVEMMHKIGGGTKNLNIIKMLGIVKPDDFGIEYGILLEFCSSGDLKNFISLKKEHTKDQLSLYDCFTGIISGMEHIHSKSLVHCDLAARNVLLKEEGGKYICKIADFGMSTEESKRDTIVQIPVRWYSPECLCYNSVGPPLDVWGFGCILIEILNWGKTPFEKKSTQEVITLFMNLIKMAPEDKKKQIVESNSFKYFGDREGGEGKINKLLLDILVKNIFLRAEERKTFTDLKGLFELHDNRTLLEQYNLLGKEDTKYTHVYANEEEEEEEEEIEEMPTEDIYTKRCDASASASALYVANPSAAAASEPQMLLYVEHTEVSGTMSGFMVATNTGGEGGGAAATVEETVTEFPDGGGGGAAAVATVEETVIESPDGGSVYFYSFFEMKKK